MTDQQSAQILQSMINFIKAHGQDRVKDIKEQMMNDFSIGKEKQVETEKTAIEKELHASNEMEIQQLKIVRSKE